MMSEGITDFILGEVYTSQGPPKFAPGQVVQVLGLAPGGYLNVRDLACGQVLGTVGNGTIGTIIDGPLPCPLQSSCSQPITFPMWKVAWPQGLSGWSSQTWLHPSEKDPCTPHWDTTIGESGLANLVRVLMEYNGDLIVGGDFITADDQTVNHIARWDGSAWHPFVSGTQTGVSGNYVRALTVYNGDLVIGGQFTTAGGQVVNNIARWDGSSWHPLISGGQIGVNSSVHSLTVYNSDLIVGGDLTMAGGQSARGIARWDGSAWYSFGGLHYPFVTPAVHALTTYNGNLIAGGRFTQPADHIARWDGVSWYPLASAGQNGVNNFVYALAVSGGNLIAGGSFTSAGGQTVNRVASWDGSTWSALGSGMSSNVYALTVFDDGTGEALYAGGTFTAAGGEPANRIALWDGSSWSPLGSGVNDRVDALTVWDYGTGEILYVGGYFATAGGQPADYITSWRGCGQHPAAVPFCFGDGLGTACPCGNSGAPGHGCANSSFTTGCRITAGGTYPSATTIVAQNAKPGQFGIVVRGTASGSPLAILDGLYCIGGNTARTDPFTINGLGEAESPVLPQGPAGVEWYYQFWYRDNDGPCSSGSNLSNGLGLLW